MRLYAEPLPHEVSAFNAIDIIKISIGALAAAILLALALRFSIEVPSLALVAASAGIIVAFKAWSFPRIGHWISAAAVLSTLLSGLAYARHIDGSVARARRMSADAQSILAFREAAEAQREAQKKVVLEAALQEEQRRRAQAEEAERLEASRREAAALATLRRTNPDKYLAQLKNKDIDLWLKDAKLLRPALYEAYSKQQKRGNVGSETSTARSHANQTALQCDSKC